MPKLKMFCKVCEIKVASDKRNYCATRDQRKTFTLIGKKVFLGH